MKAGLYGVQKFHWISGVFMEKKNWKETKLKRTLYLFSL